MADQLEPTPFKAWKRERPVASPGGTRPAMCGGPEYTAAQRLDLMREKQRAMDEAARERAEAEARKAAKRRRPKPADEDDDFLAAERLRKDRYAVKLLRQDDSAWGGGGAGTGVLG
ncbi:hypothetical protein O7602_19690 [Micromonospora sp. WMMD1128]|uniref:hypothetical protein n=1 Tax=Micromonospora sp. WMMD1128 TaxID=3015150 RepID=UPI00248AA480|nr:hypothetical protein [Micromonospora sp. WMMD1128]WBB71951.1 hypothetical protein O7602_19690 [Micromonospora sp. WMMD1128]